MRYENKNNHDEKCARSQRIVNNFERNQLFIVRSIPDKAWHQVSIEERYSIEDTSLNIYNKYKKWVLKIQFHILKSRPFKIGHLTCIIHLNLNFLLLKICIHSWNTIGYKHLKYMYLSIILCKNSDSSQLYLMRQTNIPNIPLHQETYFAYPFCFNTFLLSV